MPQAPGITAKGSIQEHLQFGKSSRWDGRFLVYAFALIALLALLISVLFYNTASNTAALKPGGAPPPFLQDPQESAPKAVSVETPNGKLFGQINTVNTAPNTASATPAAQTPVDKPDHERLLSIISNY